MYVYPSWGIGTGAWPLAIGLPRDNARVVLSVGRNDIALQAHQSLKKIWCESRKDIQAK